MWLVVALGMELVMESARGSAMEWVMASDYRSELRSVRMAMS